VVTGATVFEFVLLAVFTFVVDVGGWQDVISQIEQKTPTFVNELRFIFFMFLRYCGKKTPGGNSA
jgi:hypothetical protein